MTAKIEQRWGLALVLLMLVGLGFAQAAWAEDTLPPGVRPETLSAGHSHTCGLTSDGTVACWGSSAYSVTNPPGGTFAQISSGYGHACGVKSDGAVACWGRSDFGQTNAPAGLFSQVSAGYYHTCGVKNDGTVTCWGAGAVNTGFAPNYGQAIPPDGTFIHLSAGSYHTCGVKSDRTVACWGQNRFDEASPLAGNFTRVSAGIYHTCGLKSDGTVACWGDNNSGKTSPPAGPFTQVSAGTSHTCGVRSDGTVACWGDNDSGKTSPPAGPFTQVSSGTSHTCGLKSDGTVACWGWNGDGQATPPASLFQRPAVSAGHTHTCGLKSDGAVACWGLNNTGQSTPPIGTFIQVSAGSTHTCGVRSDSTLACWGNNGYIYDPPPTGLFTQVSAGAKYNCGVRSDGIVACWGWNDCGEARPTPTGTFIQVSAEWMHTCGVRSDGTLACWGYNNDGRATPPTGTFKLISVGSAHSCGVRSDGTLACWGDNSYGQATSPTGTFNQVSAGALHTCGVRSNGIVACWGNNSYGQATPLAGTFIEVNAGTDHTCGVRSNGNVVCWGSNAYGQLGPTLTVAKASTGAGTVSSNPTGINCGATCSATYPPLADTVVELTATAADANSLFAGWSGACTKVISLPNSTGACTVTMDADRSVTATFNPNTFTLLVVKAGSGNGTVGGGGSYTAGTTVTPTASAAAGSTLTGWSPASCGSPFALTADTTCTATFTRNSYTVTAMAGTGGSITPTAQSVAHGDTASFTVTPATGYAINTVEGCSGTQSGTAYTTGPITGACTINASFAVNSYALTVTKAGTGIGTVTSNPAGIACGSDCSETYNHGTAITLTATAATGSKFTGWTGVCTGTAATCTVSMTAARSVTATFTRPVLVVAKAGSGAGLISGTGISCGVDCTQPYNLDTVVTLTATAYTGSTFAGWSRACIGTGPCTVGMNAAKTVTATFTAVTPNTYALTLYKPGPGLGTVASNPTGLTCGTTCNASVAYFAAEANVTLTAAPAAGSTFTGWGGACTGAAPTCTIPMSAARVVTATFTRPVLTVTKTGSGAGLITGTGINCGMDCTEPYNLTTPATSITLTAAPAAGSTFTGWSGACTGMGACTVAMTAAMTAKATFNTTTPGTYALTLYKAGVGSGTVASNPAGINCGTACVANFSGGASVTLTAKPATGSTFVGWGGACAGTAPTCTVALSVARIVTASFTRPVLTVAKSGSGTVTSSPAGINCGADCSEPYNLNTSVSLTATPTTGWQFAGWSGACTGTGACTVSMTAAKTVTARFKPKLTVTRSGGGTVTSNPAGISCGTTCAAYFPFNATVTLTATPASGQKFKSWAGCTTASGNTCTVGMTATKTVTATFGL